MVVTLAIISGIILGTCLTIKVIIALYRHIKSAPFTDFLKEVMVTILLISTIVFIISMWIIFTDVVNWICIGIVLIVFFLAVAYADTY